MSLNMSLTDAFTAVFKQSPMPIQLEVERTLNSSNGLGHSSLQLGKLFQNTINCNALREKGKSSFILPSNPVPLYSWIIKPIPNTVGVCVEGKKSMDEEDYWHSGIVVKRLSSAVIETSSGSRYELMGDMVFLDALEADIPEPLAESFMKGFPENWESLVKKYLTSNTSTISNNIAAASPPDALLEITELVSQQSTDRNYDNYQNQIPNREYVTKQGNQANSTSLHEKTQNNRYHYIDRENGLCINDENVEISGHEQLPGNHQHQAQRQQYNSRINSRTDEQGHQSILPRNTQNAVKNIDFDSQNTSLPNENGSRNLNHNTNNDNGEIAAISMGGDVSNSDSLLSKTVLGKTLRKTRKSNSKSSNSQSMREKERKLVQVQTLMESEDTEGSYTQERTPYSQRQKRRIVTDDESDGNDSANSVMEAKSLQRHKKRAKIEKKQTRKSPRIDIECNKQVGKDTENSNKQNRTLQSQDDESETNSSASSQVASKSHKQYKKHDKIERRHTRSSSKSDTVDEDVEHDKHPSNKRDERKSSSKKAKSKAQESSSNLETESVPNSDSRVFTLSDWIIRPMKKLRCVLVEGKRKGIEHYWRSSSISERREPKTVVTNSGSVYKLVGNIQYLDSIEAGFHPNLVKSFTRGFPKNWEKLIEMHFDGEFEDDKVLARQKENNIDEIIEQSILNETVVGTPGGQLIDLTDIKQTRSGRIVKPALANWMGQRVKYDAHSGQLKVVYNTKFAEAVYTKEAIQLSAKTMRSKFQVKKSLPQITQRQEKMSESEENDELSQKVMKVLDTAKEKRSKRKLSEKRDTCYSRSTGRMHMKRRESRNQVSEEESEAGPKQTKEQSKTRKKVSNTMKTRKNSANSQLNSGCESSTDYEGAKTKKSKNILNNDQFNSDFSDPDEIVFKEPVKSSKPSKKQTAKSRLKNLEEKAASSSGEAFDIWGALEKKRLDHALNIIPPNDIHLWKRLADAVRTRTEEECKEYVKSEKKYAAFLSKIKPEKKMKLVKITAKKGTMKRNKQIQALLEQRLDMNEDEFDVTEATPYRTRTQKMPQVVLGDDELFGGGDFPITPASQNCRTPTIRHCLQLFSAKKTPANVHAVSSPVNNTVRKKNAEKVVHNYLKLKKKAQAKPPKKASASVSNKPRTLFHRNMVDGSIFDVGENNTDDEDEDEEKDHYFSDESFDD